MDHGTRMAHGSSIWYCFGHHRYHRGDGGAGNQYHSLGEMPVPLIRALSPNTGLVSVLHYPAIRQHWSMKELQSVRIRFRGHGRWFKFCIVSERTPLQPHSISGSDNPASERPRTGSSEMPAFEWKAGASTRVGCWLVYTRWASTPSMGSRANPQEQEAISLPCQPSGQRTQCVRASVCPKRLPSCETLLPLLVGALFRPRWSHRVPGCYWLVMRALERLVWSGADPGDVTDDDLWQTIERGLGASVEPSLAQLAFRLIRRDLDMALQLVRRLGTSHTEQAGDSAELENLFWSKYFSGLALVLAFARDQWTGPALEVNWALKCCGLEEAPARDSLDLDGEDWLAPCSCAPALVEATRLLGEIDWTSGYQAWWYIRALWLYQQCLSGPSPTLRQPILDAGRLLVSPSLTSVTIIEPPFAAAQRRTQYLTVRWACEAPLMEPFLCNVEMALFCHFYRLGEAAKEAFDRAANCIGARVVFTGQHGLRLRYQQRSLALLRATVEERNDSADGISLPRNCSTSEDRGVDAIAPSGSWLSGPGEVEKSAPESAVSFDQATLHQSRSVGSGCLDAREAVIVAVTEMAHRREPRSTTNEAFQGRDESAANSGSTLASLSTDCCLDSVSSDGRKEGPANGMGIEDANSFDAAVRIGEDRTNATWIPPRAIGLQDGEYLGHSVLIEHETETQPSQSSIKVTDSILLLTQVAIDASQQASTPLSKEQVRACVEYVVDATEQSAALRAEHCLFRAYALFVRSQWEQERARYQERVMQQMEELVHRFYEDQHQPPTIVQRLEYVFSTAYPLRWQVQREWAETLGRLGLVKSALAVFESIEMWEHVIDCHRLMGNWSRAYALITEQVRRRGASPRLLCVLGDVLVMQPQLERPSDDRRTPEELYEEAWIRSGERYARAQRSLGRLAMRRGDWQRAYDHFRLALAVNPLYQEIWFASGFCAQKAEQWDRATESYTSAVQYEPEHAEAWSNLGHALLRQSGDETTSQMLRMRRIVKCFAEAARLRPESWQIWQNLLVAAAVAQEWATAIRAQTKLIALRGREGYDRSSMATVIKAISGALEITRTQAESSLVGGATNERLLVSLEPLLRHLASIGISDALIWSTLGRCARERGEFREALEYNRKTIRALEASERRPPFGLKPTTNGCDAESERAQARSALTRAYCELGETLVAARKQQDRRDQGAVPCAMRNTAQLDRSVTAQMALFLKRISEAGDNDPTVERLREIAELLGI